MQNLIILESQYKQSGEEFLANVYLENDLQKILYSFVSERFVKILVNQDSHWDSKESVD